MPYYSFPSCILLVSGAFQVAEPYANPVDKHLVSFPGLKLTADTG